MRLVQRLIGFRYSLVQLPESRTQKRMVGRISMLMQSDLYSTIIPVAAFGTYHHFIGGKLLQGEIAPVVGGPRIS